VYTYEHILYKETLILRVFLFGHLIAILATFVSVVVIVIVIVHKYLQV
jgi:hypothetical protein